MRDGLVRGCEARATGQRPAVGPARHVAGVGDHQTGLGPGQAIGLELDREFGPQLLDKGRAHLAGPLIVRTQPERGPSDGARQVEARPTGAARGPGAMHLACVVRIRAWMMPARRCRVRRCLRIGWSRQASRPSVEPPCASCRSRPTSLPTRVGEVWRVPYQERAAQAAAGRGRTASGRPPRTGCGSASSPSTSRTPSASRDSSCSWAAGPARVRSTTTAACAHSSTATSPRSRG